MLAFLLIGCNCTAAFIYCDCVLFSLLFQFAGFDRGRGRGGFGGRDGRGGAGGRGGGRGGPGGGMKVDKKVIVEAHHYEGEEIAPNVFDALP